MRKSLDEIWKTPTPDMLEIRQEGIGTLRPIQQPGEEKIGGKRLQDTNANHNRDTFPCLLLFFQIKARSICQFPFQHNRHILVATD